MSLALVRFAPDGGAVPGDRIIGIVTPGEGITIYPIQSPTLKDFEDTPERWLDVRWDMDDRTPQRFPARIAIQSVNEPGTLAQIAQVIAAAEVGVGLAIVLQLYRLRGTVTVDDVRLDEHTPDTGPQAVVGSPALTGSGAAATTPAAPTTPGQARGPATGPAAGADR